MIASLSAIVISLLAAALQGAIIYFPLQALATILKILMEMEFNSRWYRWGDFRFPSVSRDHGQIWNAAEGDRSLGVNPKKARH
jgi:hypothetical protein